ncbi:hypothetical protein ACEVAQ_18880 [Ectopseudomonas khazarica]|uniref:DUF4145 domain-containing protein n=1 Tax=Ectopseudomonas khazarica TaxID=2502979 RepID=A0ABW7MGQ2_9GAMM
MFNPAAITPDEIGEYSWIAMSFRDSPSAHDYLDFAQQDLHDGNTSRHLINALSNAKRSLHMRLEDLCLGFGARDLKKLGRYPSLIDFIRKCGFVAPRILDKINKARNSVEHEFKIPTHEETENFVDIVELFLSATDRWRYRQPCDVDIKHIASSGSIALHGISFNWKNGICTLYIGTPEQRKIHCTTQMINSDQPIFFEWVKLTLKNDY